MNSILLHIYGTDGNGYILHGNRLLGRLQHSYEHNFKMVLEQIGPDDKNRDQ